ncbi:MAG: hypothetical protein QG671_3609 [Actinomycetota bacterium]|nr:hypothetical protein [Actinomycetota bacterium]
MTDPLARWEMQARIAMSRRGIRPDTAAPLIAQVRAHCADTGQGPDEAFGAPQEFAETAAAQLPAESLDPVDRQGLAAIDHLTGSLVLPAVLLLVSSIVALLSGIVTVPLTPAALVGVALMVLGHVAVVGLPGTLRAAGRPTAARASFGLAAVAVLLAALSFTQLPRTRLGEIPTPVTGAVAALLLWLLFRRDGAAARRGPARTAPTASEDGWLRRLNGLLVGRHEVTPQRAADLVDEARAHLRAAGTSPDEEFGPIDVYAGQLAEHETARRRPRWRGRTAGAVLDLLRRGDRRA